MQINRLFEMIYILLDKENVCAKDLAEQFEVSTRTIYRDVEILSSAGIPIFMTKGKGGGIHLLPDFILNKAVLTAEEKGDIVSSLQAIRAIKFNETDSVLQKVGSFFGENHADWIEVDFSSWYNAGKEVETFQCIKSAILSKKVICFTYTSQKGEATSREVEPLRLCFKGMARYLYAYCGLREDYRFFKLSRIRDLSITEKRFERKIVEPIFKKETMFQEQYVTLLLKIAPSMAYRVFDEFDDYTQDTDGNFLVKMKYPMGEWLFPYISSFGSKCEVLEPLEIRTMVWEELNKMTKNYL